MPGISIIKKIIYPFWSEIPLLLPGVWQLAAKPVRHFRPFCSKLHPLLKAFTNNWALCTNVVHLFSTIEISTQHFRLIYSCEYLLLCSVNIYYYSIVLNIWQKVHLWNVYIWKSWYGKNMMDINCHIYENWNSFSCRWRRKQANEEKQKYLWAIRTQLCKSHFHWQTLLETFYLTLS